MFKLLTRKPVLGWAFYDWANSAFATTIMAGFFPVFFNQYWSIGEAGTTTTFRLGLVNGIGSLIIAFLAPILGAIADRGGNRIRFLVTFAGLGVVMTGALFFVAQGQWLFAVAIYMFASMGFAGGNVFYDSLLVDVAEEKHFSLISGYGYGMGYLGGGLLFLVNVLMTIYPQSFGLADASEAVRWSFLTVAIWWAVFSIPVFLWVKEAPTKNVSEGWGAIGSGFRQLAGTFRKVSKMKTLLLFLAAYWLYIDGVNTVIKMAVDFGIKLNLEASDLMLALLLTQFVAFPAALAFGWLGTKIGAKKGILIGLVVYTLSILWAGFYLSETRDFFMLAVAIGLVQGGVQSLSRALYAGIIPSDKTAEFFGFYNMLGKFAAVLGPFLVAGVAVLTQSSRGAIMAVLPLFLIGGVLLLFVNVERGQQDAKGLVGALNETESPREL